MSLTSFLSILTDLTIGAMAFRLAKQVQIGLEILTSRVSAIELHLKEKL